MALLPGDAGSQPVRFQPRPAPAAPPPSQWRGFPSAAAPVRSAGAPPTHTDASTGGGNYGATQANAFKQSPGYRQAIVETYLHQPIAQQGAIVRGALSIPSLEGHAVLNYLKSQGTNPRSVLVQASDTQHAKSGGIDLGQIPGVGLIGGGLNRMFSGKNGGGTDQGGVLGTATPFGGPKGAEKILKGAASDAYNLPGNTLQGLAGISSQIGKGHVGNALSMLVDPYLHLFTHPETALQHPLNTALMLGGPEAALGRSAGAVARSGALGKGAAAAADTARAPLRLGPDVAGAPSSILEHRSYSPNVITKSAQVGRENVLRKRGIDPNVARPAPAVMPKWLQNSLNVGLDAKTRRPMDEMAAVQQMASREGRSKGTDAINSARPKSVAAQGVVSHFLQGVLRTPATAIEDATKEINRLRSEQGPRSPALWQNRAQIRSLDRATKEPGAMQAAFDSSNKIRDWLHTRDAYAVGQGLLPHDMAARTRVIAYAQAHMGAKYDHVQREFVDHAGAPLPTQTILDHIAGKRGEGEAAGAKMPDPAYVGHMPGKQAPWNFYQKYRAARGSLAGAKRTGEAFRKGGYDHTFNGLVAQAARTEQAVTKAGLHDRIVNRFGIGKPGHLQAPGENGFWNKAEAQKYVHASTHDDHGNPIPGAQPLTAMVAFHHKTPISAVENLLHPSELHHLDGLELQAIDRSVAEAKNSTARNIVLVPERVLDQAKEQYKSASRGARAFGKVTQQFKRTVLPYSTHWMTQIASEAVLRSLVAGVLDPRNIVAGHQLMAALKAHGEEGLNVGRETTNATFYHKNDPLMVHNPNPSTLSKVVHGTPLLGDRTLPLPRGHAIPGLVGAHNMYANKIGATIGRLEHEFRIMGLGKLARKDLQEFTKSYQAGVRLSGANLDHLTRRLTTDPAKVAQFGRQIDDIFGKYNKLTPQVRSGVQSFVPFLPWSLNAAKFVLWNLPVKHPVASSLLAALRQTINQDVQDGKQLPLNQYQAEALGKFTPFSIIPPNPNAGSTLQQLTQPILPEASGAYNVLHGQNVFGDTALKGPRGDVKSGTSGTVAPAVEALLESMLPLLRDVRTAREGGGTAYGTSTLLNPQTKPGSKGSVLDRIFNPLHAYASATAHPPRTGAKAAANGNWSIVPNGPASTTGQGTGGPWKIVAP